MEAICGPNIVKPALIGIEAVENLPFFEPLSIPARSHFISITEPVHISAGTQFITQGEEGDSFYIIKAGTCCVTLMKDGTLHPIAIMGPGDIVGEMAILTGEQRNADVTAQTDLDLLRVTRETFDEICSEFPEIRHFLTQTVTGRFARASITADRTIAKYTITSIIGKGGWSVVYRGIHTHLNMPVAIKMLKHSLAMDTVFLDEFRNEARTIANLNHPNIVKIYDIEQLYRTVFIIMEYLDGDSLESVLKRQDKIELKEAVNILLQTCFGLQYAHEQGLVHRDIKPGNIFRQSNGTIKILDFGLACPRGTKGDRIVGTPKYVSPEQIKGEPVDERSDIYSLGMMTYKMVTSKDAFNISDLPTLLQMQLYEDVPDPILVSCDCPEELRRFIKKATRKKPEDRYQTVKEIIPLLQPLAMRLGMDFDSRTVRKVNFTNLFLLYRDEQEEMLRKLIETFGQELAKTGVVLKKSDFKDVKINT